MPSYLIYLRLCPLSLRPLCSSRKCILVWLKLRNHLVRAHTRACFLSYNCNTGCSSTQKTYMEIVMFGDFLLFFSPLF